MRYFTLYAEASGDYKVTATTVLVPPLLLIYYVLWRPDSPDLPCILPWSNGCYGLLSLWPFTVFWGLVNLHHLHLQTVFHHRVSTGPMWNFSPLLFHSHYVSQKQTPFRGVTVLPSRLPTHPHAQYIPYTAMSILFLQLTDLAHSSVVADLLPCPKFM